MLNFSGNLVVDKKRPLRYYDYPYSTDLSDNDEDSDDWTQREKDKDRALSERSKTNRVDNPTATGPISTIRNQASVLTDGT